MRWRIVGFCRCLVKSGAWQVSSAIAILGWLPATPPLSRHYDRGGGVVRSPLTVSLPQFRMARQSYTV